MFTAIVTMPQLGLRMDGRSRRPALRAPRVGSQELSRGEAPAKTCCHPAFCVASFWWKRAPWLQAEPQALPLYPSSPTPRPPLQGLQGCRSQTPLCLHQWRDCSIPKDRSSLVHRARSLRRLGNRPLGPPEIWVTHMRRAQAHCLSLSLASHPHSGCSDHGPPLSQP